jgi:hypothetical protein
MTAQQPLVSMHLISMKLGVEKAIRLSQSGVRRDRPVG